jgi:hypothetical protein
MLAASVVTSSPFTLQPRTQEGQASPSTAAGHRLIFASGPAACFITEALPQ